MYRHLKRYFDIIVAAVALIMSSPLLLVVYIAIRLDSSGPVIFRQVRLGLNGEPFEMLKFRSMTVGAEAAGVYESIADPRVTKIGSIIRKSSIDELPQFVNILRGEMSFIGPRPTLTYHPWPIDKYTSEQRKRFLVKPGITGWAQIQGRKSIDWERRLKYDVEYVNNLSFLLDAKILLKTVVKIFSNADNVNTGETVDPLTKGKKFKGEG